MYTLIGACCRCVVEIEKIATSKKHASNQLQVYGVSELVLATTSEIPVIKDSLGDAIKSLRK